MAATGFTAHLAERQAESAESAETQIKPDDYVLVDGYRLVKPYYFDFCCNVRQRWLGHSIIDIFTREFPARDRQYYLQAFADGRLRVEGCQVAADTPLKDGQRMRHFIHRHEPPVPAAEIPVVGLTASAVAVCKPAGMPVHVAGQYRKNTVLGVLTAERPDLGPLHPVHRLDKPVSGLLLFARSPAAAAALGASIEGREVEKTYVARVLGRFPESQSPVVADVPLAWDPVNNFATAEPGAAADAPATDDANPLPVAPASAVCESGATGAQERQQQDLAPQQQQQQQQEEGVPEQPLDLREARRLRKQQKRQGKQAKAERKAAAAAAAAAAAGRSGKKAAKPALTEFKLLAVAADGLTSIVECRPRTGRTHQIRVHLQHLGHPIANDVQYGGTYGGPQSSRSMAQQLGVQWRKAEPEGAAPADAAESGSKRARVERAPGFAAADGQRAPTMAEVGQAGAQLAAGDSCEQTGVVRCQLEYRAAEEFRDPMCIHCPYYAPMDYPSDLRPLWLHARSYSCASQGWSFSTELPEWAHADWAPCT